MDTLNRLWHDPAGIVGMLTIAIAIFVAVSASILSPYDPYKAGGGNILAPPSIQYVLGTDDIGKDVLSQLFYGTRVSLTVGFAASLISISVGAIVGLASGYYGRLVDSMLMRMTDFLMVIPSLPLMIVIATFGGHSVLKIILVIGLLGWTPVARLVRSQVLSIKERDFILSARVIGAGNWRIITRHVFPHVFPLLIAQTVLNTSAAILAEASLSFLGLGDPTVISWGTMLHFAFERAVSRQAWWFILPPGLAIVWVSLGVALVGKAIERIVNPQLNTWHPNKAIPEK